MCAHSPLRSRCAPVAVVHTRRRRRANSGGGHRSQQRRGEARWRRAQRHGPPHTSQLSVHTDTPHARSSGRQAQTGERTHGLSGTGSTPQCVASAGVSLLRGPRCLCVRQCRSSTPSSRVRRWFARSTRSRRRQPRRRPRPLQPTRRRHRAACWCTTPRRRCCSSTGRGCWRSRPRWRRAALRTLARRACERCCRRRRLVTSCTRRCCTSPRCRCVCLLQRTVPPSSRILCPLRCRAGSANARRPARARCRVVPRPPQSAAQHRRSHRAGGP